MSLPVTKCCFCLSLDAGAKVIAVINLISSVLTCAVYGAAATVPSAAAGSRRAVYGLVTVASLLQLAGGCVLFYGLFKKKPRLFMPWLVTAWLYCIVLLALSIFGALLIILDYTKNQETADEISIMVSVYFLHGAVLYYFASVVSSRREEILRKDSSDSAQRLMRHRYFPESVAV